MLRKIVKIVFLVLWTMVATTSLFAQDSREREGDEKMERYAYIDAIKIYERVANKGYESMSLFKNLADSYYFNGRLVEAHNWYDKMFHLKQSEELDIVEDEQQESISSESYYRYGQTLKAMGYYVKADSIMDRFATLEPEDSRSTKIKKEKDYLEEIEKNSGRYTISIMDINTPYSDYGATIYNDELIFTSARDTGGFSKKTHDWTGESFTSLYAVSLQEGGYTGKVRRFAKELKSKFNESSPVFTADGQTMYFTRNNLIQGKRGKNKEGGTLLKLYKANLVDGRWKNVEELPFNSDDYSTAHAALAPDGKWLYFASDRSGGYGQSDLYKVALLPDGGYGEPINLGEKINTEGRESFPFISGDNELYFATDGRPGLGGLDIYGTKIREDSSLSEVKNLGVLANTSMDDFAYYIDSNTRKGFLSSNRNSDDEKDNVFSFTETKRLDFDCAQSIEGKVYDQKNSEVLVNAKVTLFDARFGALDHTQTSEDGSYHFDKLSCGFTYHIHVELASYTIAERRIELPEETGVLEVNIGLSKILTEVAKGDDLFKTLRLEPIFFDFDDAHIRADAQVELAKIVEVLREFPDMRIEVLSHTDSRGRRDYNLSLSQRRADATVTWLVEQGIDAKRLKGKGYGETRLLQPCSIKHPCSELDHQKNRRSEFIVVDL